MIYDKQRCQFPLLIILTKIMQLKYLKLDEYFKFITAVFLSLHFYTLAVNTDRGSGRKHYKKYNMCAVLIKTDNQKQG
jgi:hypothetical protein